MFGDFDLVVFLRDILQNFGLGKSLSVLLVSLIMVILVVFLSWLAYILARFFIDRIVTVVVRKSKFKWDDIFLDNKVFTRLSHFAPAVVIHMMAGLALDPYPGWLEFVQKLTYLYMIIAGMLFLFSFVNAWHKIYQTLPISEHRHIKGYLQLLKIFIGFIALLIVISVIFNKDLTTLIAGLGAMAAVLLLIFKDTILGLVASVQLSANNMVRIGDWISMPSRGADGTVLDITLNTVKVENFDKTIVTVPTYSLVQESFQNWSGMERSGGRRMKRAVHIDVRSIKFLDKEETDRFRKIQILRDYIDHKEKDLENYNKEHNIDNSVLINGRRMTNVGTFRAYINAYLKQHPKIHNDMTFLVRQLPVTEKGLPVEIYVFSKVQEWAKYEAIQADIFDHLLAVVPEFGLRIFQNPTGNDFQQLRN